MNDQQIVCAEGHPVAHPGELPILPCGCPLKGATKEALEAAGIEVTE